MFSKILSNGETHVLGLMSGTSGDGIDGALVTFRADGGFSLRWNDSETFPPEVRKHLQRLMAGCTSRDVMLASTFVGSLYSRAANAFLSRHHETVTMLAAHGQTLDHDPDGLDWDGIPVRGSLQVLNAGLLAEETGIPVAYDFRTRDMAVGGQGAPLVPFGDLRFFGHLCKKGLLVLNVGGIANVTVIRPDSNTKIAGISAAFDTGPGNMLMDALADRLSGGAESFDRGGRIAKSGVSDPRLLAELLADSFLEKSPPKSTGRDRFGRLRLEGIRQSWCGRMPPEAMMSTLLDLTVESIGRAVEKFICPEGPLDLAIVAGGGASNEELVRRLSSRLSCVCPVRISRDFGVPVQAREAMGFAALGDALVRGVPANVPAATGAGRRVLLGAWVPGRA